MHTSRHRDLTTPSLSATFLVCFFLISGLRTGQSTHDHAAPENLGVVSFSTSCKLWVQKDFERSVALLHSFAYSAAEASFRRVLEKDPNCAIAHWGVAMTYFHQLWDPPIQRDAISLGREEIRRAQEIGGGTDRERGFIRALALFYDRDFAAIPYRQRVYEYERAMGELAAAYPEDAELQVFYALALLASASPLEEAHSRQKHAVKILDIALNDLLPHAPEALVALQSVKPGRVVHVGR